MGQNNSLDSICNTQNRRCSKSQNDLTFYMNVNDERFGSVPVYAATQKPSCFVVKLQKQYTNSKVFNTFEHIESHQLPSLVNLHAFQVQRKRFLTGSFKETVTSYWQYYNHSLEQYIRLRHVKKLPFYQKQLWLIVKSCCQSFNLFNRYGLLFQLDMKNMVIIPEGKVTIYWHDIENQNKHIRFYKKLQELNKNPINQVRGQCQKYFCSYRLEQSEGQKGFFFSPQELKWLQKRQIVTQLRQGTAHLDFVRTNSFRLGMILLYCITLTNPLKTCYHRDKLHLKSMILNSLFQNQVQNSPKYSVDLKHLIKLLIQQEPSKRIPITCLETVYERFLNQQLQLLMGQNQNPFKDESSSRKDLKEEDIPVFQFQKPNLSLAPGSVKKLKQKYHLTEQQRNSSERREGRVSSERNMEREERESQNDEANSREYDKYDTKTIKMTSTHRK